MKLIQIAIITAAGFSVVAPAQAIQKAEGTKIAAGTMSTVPDRDAARVARMFAVENSTPGATPAHLQVPLAQSLSAFALLANGVNQSGRGDAEYWMRSASIAARTAQAMGRGLATVASVSGQGPIGAALTGIAGQLSSISGAGNGNSDYWMARTSDIVERVQGAGKQLKILAESLPGAGNPTVALGAVVNGLAAVALNLDSSGRGDAEYWMKTTRDFTLVGRAVGQALRSLAAGAPVPANSVLEAFASQLNSLDDAGQGNADYWLARASGIANQTISVGRSLETVGGSL